VAHALEAESLHRHAGAAKLLGEGFALVAQGARSAVMTSAGGRPDRAWMGTAARLRRGSAKSASEVIVWPKNQFMKPEYSGLASAASV